MYGSRMRVNSGLGETIGSVKRDIQDITRTGNFYCTNEIARELSSINNALEHLKLDRNFLYTSPNWRKGAHERTGINGNNNAAEILQNVSKHLYDYKTKMGNRSMENRQENEIRELHQWTLQNLRGLQRSLEPYTQAAESRIQQFGDFVGVTDRYTGYRHNLTRGNRDPFSMNTQWMGRSVPNGFMNSLASRVGSAGQFRQMQPRGILNRSKSAALGTRVTFGSHLPPKTTNYGYRTIDSLYPRSNSMYVDNPTLYSEKLNEIKTLNSLNATRDDQALMDVTQARGMKNLSVQEQAGINTAFPGRTEYMTKFTEPPMDIPTSHFNINPTPDFTLHGRPLATAHFDPSNTEYQARYEWPDGNKIVQMPWLRK